MAKIMMKKERMIRMSLSMTKEEKMASSMFRRALTRETDLRGLSTLSTLKGFKLRLDRNSCKKLDTIIIKSSLLKLFFK